MTNNADVDAAIELEFKRLRFNQRHHAERMSGTQGMVPAIKMVIGEWYIMSSVC